MCGVKAIGDKTLAGGCVKRGMAQAAFEAVLRLDRLVDDVPLGYTAAKMSNDVAHSLQEHIPAGRQSQRFSSPFRQILMPDCRVTAQSEGVVCCEAGDVICGAVIGGAASGLSGAPFHLIAGDYDRRLAH